MFKYLLYSLALGSFPVLTAGAGDEAKKDLEKLQGTWTVLQLVEGGEKAPAEEIKSMSVHCKNDEISVKTILPDKKEVEIRFKIKLDPEKSPKVVDFTHNFIKDLIGKKQLGIYKVDGDTLTFCYAEIDKERPKEFASPAKTDVTLVVLKRK